MSSPAGVVWVISPSAITAVGAVFPALCIIVVGLRLYTRRLQNARLELDDWFSIAALILTIAMGIDLIIGEEGKALGYPTPLPSPDTVPAETTFLPPQESLALKVRFSFQLMLVWALSFVKLSILFFYRRVFYTGQAGIFDLTTKVLIATVTVWTIGFFLAMLLRCGTNIPANWGDVATLLTCGEPFFTIEDGLGISDFILDLLILVLPIPKIWSLHLKPAQKLAVTGIFMLGSVVLVASIIRMYIFIIAVQAGFNSHSNEDLEVTEELYWSMIELGLALIAACLPSLQFLYRRISLQSLVHSVRSVVSLSSLRSRLNDAASGINDTQGSTAITRGSYIDSEAGSEMELHVVEASKVGILK